MAPDLGYGISDGDYGPSDLRKTGSLVNRRPEMATEAPDTTVGRQMDVLGKEIDLLRDVTNGLEEILGPILRAEGHEGIDSDTTAWPNIPISPVSARIRDLTDSLRRTRQDIIGILGRVNL